METKISTKFTTATEHGIAILSTLTKEIYKEKFAGLLPAAVVDKHIGDTFNLNRLISELNSLSNQWIVVYSNEAPAGYAVVTSKGQRPETLRDKKIIRIAEFGILNKYDDPRIKQSLFEKCLILCKSYETIWINEYAENPFIGFFEANSFLKQKEVLNHYELPLPSVYLTKEKV